MKINQNNNLNDYYTQNRSEMIEFVPKSAKFILDVGCGAGIFAKQLKKNINAQVWGIEMNETAANCAKQILDHVLIGNAVKIIQKLPDNYFDCVIMNDILEHLIDPYDFLLQVKSKLTTDGVVVCSIPNVRYLPNLINLFIKKQWQYEDQGILDKTHLRFFTRKSIVSTFEDLGFEILKLKGINPIQSWKFKFLNFIFLGQLADTKYMQFAVIAK